MSYLVPSERRRRFLRNDYQPRAFGAFLFALSLPQALPERWQTQEVRRSKYGHAQTSVVVTVRIAVEDVFLVRNVLYQQFVTIPLPTGEAENNAAPPVLSLTAFVAGI